MLETNKGIYDLILLADMKGLEISSFGITNFNFYDEEKKSYDITVKSEKGIESKIKEFLFSCLIDRYSIYSVYTSENNYINIRFYEIKGGENESN